MNSDPIKSNIRLLCVLVASGEYTTFKRFLSFLLKAHGINTEEKNQELMDVLNFVVNKTLKLMFRSCPHYVTHTYLTTLNSYEKALKSMFNELDLDSFISNEFFFAIDEFEFSGFFRAPQLNLEWMDCHDLNFQICGYEVIDKFFYVFETSNLVYAGTTGFKTWPASIHLANFIAENVIYSTSIDWTHGPKKWTNVFELGSGITGFLGVTMQDVLSSPKWTFSDKAMDDGAMIRTNAQLNSLPEMCAHFLKFDWDFPLPQDIGPAQLIVATDVIFDPEITLKFLKTARELVTQLTDANGIAPDFLLCNAIRRNSSHEHFLENARNMDFDIKVLDQWSGLKWSRELRGRVAVVASDYNIPMDESDPFMSKEHVPLTGDDTPTVVYYLKLNKPH